MLIARVSVVENNYGAIKAAEDDPWSFHFSVRNDRTERDVCGAPWTLPFRAVFVCRKLYF
jgi:hypothetical protein